jgi:hypothetical protein
MRRGALRELPRSGEEGVKDDDNDSHDEDDEQKDSQEE